MRQRGGRLLLRIEDVDAGRARARHRGRDPRATSTGSAWPGTRRRRRSRRATTRPRWRGSRRTPTAALAPRGRGRRRPCGAEAGRRSGWGLPACRTRARAGAVRFALPRGVETIVDRARGRADVDLATLADPVLQRRDGCFTYSLAVVADDIADGVTEVVRGADLADQSAVQAVLWRALGAEPPAWLHAPLILGGDGRSYRSRIGAAAVGDLRGLGWSAGDVWRVVLPWLGLTPHRDRPRGSALLHHALARLRRHADAPRAFHLDAWSHDHAHTSSRPTHRVRPRPRLHGHVRVLRPDRRSRGHRHHPSRPRSRRHAARHRGRLRAVHQRDPGRQGGQGPPRRRRRRHQVRHRPRPGNARAPRHQRQARLRPRSRARPA